MKGDKKDSQLEPFDFGQKKVEFSSVSQKDNEVTPPEGWEEALTPEEFFEEAKKLIRRKFQERNKI